MITSAYSTLCYLLDYDKLLSLDSIRKSILNNKEKPVFSPSRTSYYGQRIFNQTYVDKDGVYPYEPDKYLYNMIIPEPEIRIHQSNEPKKLSNFANTTAFCILCNFSKIAPSSLFKNIINTNNLDEFCDVLSNYTSEYNKIMDTIYQQYETRKDPSIINDFIALETIIPIRLVYTSINLIDQIRGIFYYKITTTTDLIRALTVAVESPVFYNIMDFYCNAINGLSTNNIYLNYDYINSSIPEDIPTMDQERITIWSSNLEKSISMFSNITFPLVSKAFFTILFKVYFNGNEDNIKDTLMNIKNDLERKILPTIKNRRLDYDKVMHNLRLVDDETLKDIKLVALFILYYTINASTDRLYKNIDEYTFSLSRDNSLSLFYGHHNEKEFERDYAMRQKTNQKNIKNFIDIANNDYINIFKTKTHDDMRDIFKMLKN